MKKIVVKEIDKLKSTMFGDKVVSEYLIYLIMKQDGNEVKLEGYTEYGEKNKDAKVNELIIEHFINNETLSKINKKEIIQEISFLEHLKS